MVLFTRKCKLFTLLISSETQASLNALVASVKDDHTKLDNLQNQLEQLRQGVALSVPNSIPVFFNTPHFVIPYHIFNTGAVSSISL
jgi:hypothetical protein